MFKSHIKLALKRSFLFMKGDSLLRICNRTPRILFWHGVDYRSNPEVEQEICDISIFERQIDYLRHNFEIISIQEFEKRLIEDRFTGREVVLTFDDGYANNLYVVEPILSQYSLPFTVFISTEHIERGFYFPTSVNRIITLGSGIEVVKIPSLNLELSLSNSKLAYSAYSVISSIMKRSPLEVVRKMTDELINNVNDVQWKELMDRYKTVRPMTWNEVKLLSAKGATLGSHCMWHICCHDKQDHQIVEEQIRLSKMQIEDKIKTECRYFAYPNGDYTDYSNVCLKNNYKLGFTTRMRERIHTNMDWSIIPRMGIPLNFDTFKILLNLYPKR